MPSQLFHDLMDLESETLEAAPISADNLPAAYPYPNLKPSGMFQMMTFRTVVMENDFVRYTINLDLGGRIQEILDKRTGIEVLPKLNRLPIQAAGPRGAHLVSGIQWLADRGIRANSLGSVEFVSREADEPEEPVVLILHELISGLGLSLQVTLSLEPDTVDLDVSCRILNRTMRSQPAELGVRVAASYGGIWGRPGAAGFYHVGRDAGLEVVTDFAGIGQAEKLADELIMSLEPGLILAPRQSLSWNAILRPISGLRNLSEVGGGIAVSVSADSLKLQGNTPGEKLNVFLLTESGQTLEMTCEVESKPLTFPLEGAAASPKSILIRNAAKETLLQWEGGETPANSAFPDPYAAQPSEDHTRRLSEISPNSTARLAARTRQVSSRATAHLQLGALALSQEKYSEASAHFEQSLLFNGDDPLTWWIAATAKRLAGETENQELLNAHYLAPLEPALRAESFLSQERLQSREPNPILTPIGKHPEALLEVASLLLESGLWVEAGRWIDEALRHQDLPMLRYHQAYLLLTKSRMLAQAQEQITLVEPIPLDGPFPWRNTEWEVLSTLAGHFPESQRIRQLLRFRS